MFPHFHSFFSPVPLFQLLYYFFYLCSSFLWETTQNDPQGLTSLNRNTIHQKNNYSFLLRYLDYLINADNDYFNQIVDTIYPELLCPSPSWFNCWFSSVLAASVSDVTRSVEHHRKKKKKKKKSENQIKSLWWNEDEGIWQAHRHGQSELKTLVETRRPEHQTSSL